MPRIFIGIKIKVQRKIIEIGDELRHQLKNSNITWMDPANLHLTLKFLGEIEPFYLNSISALIEDTQLRYCAFKLKIGRLNYFGTELQPRVILFEIEHNPILTSLQKSIDESLAALGFEMEHKKYNPHLTLGRIKHLKDLVAFKASLEKNKFYEEVIDVKEFQLFESILRKEGPVYKELKIYKLNN